MKKEVKAIVAVVLAVWILVMGIEIGSIREKKKIASANATTTTATTTAPTTTEPTTTAPTTTQPTTQPSTQPSTQAPVIPGVTDVPSTAAPSAADPSTMSKEEILNKVVEAVNKVKNEQNMTARKTEKITVNLTALSIEPARNTVNNVIKEIVGEPSDETITVANGIATFPDGSTKPIKEAIPPSNDVTKDFSLTIAGVKDASAVKQGDNIVYTVNLVEEATTAASPKPTHNAVAIGYLDLMSVELPSIVTIIDSNMQYPGSTVEVTVDGQGRVIKLVNKMPMSGDGTAKIKLIGEGKAEFEGALDEVWEFTY